MTTRTATLKGADWNRGIFVQLIYVDGRYSGFAWFSRSMGNSAEYDRQQNALARIAAGENPAALVAEVLNVNAYDLLKGEPVWAAR